MSISCSEGKCCSWNSLCFWVRHPPQGKSDLPQRTWHAAQTFRGRAASDIMYGREAALSSSAADWFGENGNMPEHNCLWSKRSCIKYAFLFHLSWDYLWQRHQSSNEIPSEKQLPNSCSEQEEDGLSRTKFTSHWPVWKLTDWDQIANATWCSYAF